MPILTWKSAAILAALSLTLFACTTTPHTAIVQNCPPLKTYSADYQTAAAAELLAMGDRFPHVSGMIVDYGAERAALRACQ